MLAAIAGNAIQHRLVWSGEGLKPKLDRISPLAGLKRLFSKHALVNFVKGLLKLLVIGSIMTVLLWPERDRLESFITLDVAALLPMVHGPTLKPCSPSSRRRISCSSISNGTSARKCRSATSRRNTSRARAIRISRPASAACANSGSESA